MAETACCQFETLEIKNEPSGSLITKLETISCFMNLVVWAYLPQVASDISISLKPSFMPFRAPPSYLAGGFDLK